MDHDASREDPAVILPDEVASILTGRQQLAPPVAAQPAKQVGGGMRMVAIHAHPQIGDAMTCLGARGPQIGEAFRKGPDAGMATKAAYRRTDHLGIFSEARDDAADIAVVQGLCIAGEQIRYGQAIHNAEIIRPHILLHR